jgi:hypothetical protein
MNKTVVVGLMVYAEGDTIHWYPQSYAEKQDATKLLFCQGYVVVSDTQITLTLPGKKDEDRILYLKLRLQHGECPCVKVMFVATQYTNIKKVIVHF